MPLEPGRVLSLDCGKLWQTRLSEEDARFVIFWGGKLYARHV